jgi:hypothetical protein
MSQFIYTAWLSIGSRAIRRLLLAGLMASALNAADDCALKVNVIDASGAPVRSAFVDLHDSKGNLVVQTMAKDGWAEICDFGFGEHSLIIGKNSPFHITVSRISFTPGFPQTIKVVTNESTGFPHNSTGCPAYLRIADDSGRGVSGGTIKPSRQFVQTADRFGRVLLFLGRGKIVPVEVSADGYDSTTVSISCPRIERVEKSIALKRSQK